VCAACSRSTSSGRLLEWWAALGTWSMLEATGQIVDPALQVPLPIAAVIHSVKADDAVARALIAKRNAVLEALRASSRAEGREVGEAEGRAAGKAEAVLAVLIARGLSPDGLERDRVLGERDPARLERWIARAVACASVAELLAEP
jgi:hypothetical protein